MNAEEVALARQLIAIAVGKESLRAPPRQHTRCLGASCCNGLRIALPDLLSLSMCAVFLPTDHVHTHTYACMQAYSIQSIYT